MKNYSIIAFLLLMNCFLVEAQKTVDYVNPFIGTSNYGTTNPGAIVPNGMMSVSPFNVSGSDKNKFDKDKQWWSTPYTHDNVFFTGFSHVNLSGVGCPDLGSILVMPTTGDLNMIPKDYGSFYHDEKAAPGYYSVFLTKYNIKAEVSATEHSSIERYTFPKGTANIILNLGEGLTNESGAWLKKVSDTEYEGMRFMGSFCYRQDAVYPLYFVIRVNKKPNETGYWKKQPKMGAEAQWDQYSGKIKPYAKYKRDLAGTDIGAYFSYQLSEEEPIEVQVGVSAVSVENARANLETEQHGFNFEKVQQNAAKQWNDVLSKVEVKGGTNDEKTIFYTALYHAQIHPNILNDVNGQYPAMGQDTILKAEHPRYTVYSLWDTYRNLHSLLTLLYPKKQLDMVRSMVDMYKESGWLPRWELYSTETYTMEGDPAIPVIVNTWQKGLRDFDVNLAYEAMRKSAFQLVNNPLREDNKDYWQMGYIPIRSKFDNSVSHALEYYTADHALSKLAVALGKKDDAERLRKQSFNYKKYYSSQYQLFRPILPDGKFLSPFNPSQGKNFESVPGFHEGSSWNYSFMVPFDVKGLIALYGGKNKFVKQLQKVFDEGHYDPTNEPDLGYPYLFSYIKGEEWRTQELTQNLLKKYYRNDPAGLPGNDDTGTLSAWAVFNMMGFYPDDPTDPSYTLTTPVFDEVVLNLSNLQDQTHQLKISVKRNKPTANIIDYVLVDGKRLKGFRISHDLLLKTQNMVFHLRDK